jgi:hypothetical protein
MITMLVAVTVTMMVEIHMAKTVLITDLKMAVMTVSMMGATVLTMVMSILCVEMMEMSLHQDFLRETKMREYLTGQIPMQSQSWRGTMLCLRCKMRGITNMTVRTTI